MRDSLWIGIGVGILTGLWMWAEYAVGLHTSRAELGRYTGFLSIIFPIAGVILALRHVRAREGQLSFRRGLGAVIVLSFFATLAMALMSFVYATWINPAWLVQTRMTVGQFVLQGAIAAMVGGGVIGVIALFFMRTKRPKATAP